MAWLSLAVSGSAASFFPCRMPLCRLNRCRMQCRGQALAFKCFAELKPELEGLDTEGLYMLKPPCLSLPFQK